MAMVQVMQTVLYNHIRQLQPSDLSSSNFRGDHHVAKPKTIISYKQRFMRRRNWHSIGPVYCLKTSEVEQEEGKKTTKEWAVKKGLSALDAYFDKLHASNGTTSHSQGISGVSTTVEPPSSTGSVQNSPEAPNDHGAKRNLGDLSALDSYFKKLRPSEPGKGKTDECFPNSLYCWM